jgi:molybdopterin/thiamine biosynthesis adenylyltransferase
MDVKIITTKNMYDAMMSQLFPANNPLEQFGFIVTGLSKHKDGINLLCRKFIFADESCLIKQTRVSVVPDPRFVQYVWSIVKECNGGLITVHTHPFSKEHVSFSGIDDRSEADSFPREAEFLGEGPHANMVLGTNSIDARWYNTKDNNVLPVKEVKIVSETGIKVLKPTSQIEDAADRTDVEEIHDRQVLAFGKVGQNLLGKQKVGIVGCGGIGSILFILLVRLGVQDFVLIDHDRVEMSNLNRLAGSRLSDVKNKRLKVQMLANYVWKINPHARIEMVSDSIFSSEAGSALKSCDYIFGGTDNQSTRDLLNTYAIHHMMPYIDCGTGIQAGAHYNIEHAGGQVRTVIPGLGCLKCIDGINMDVAKMEQLPKEQREFMAQRGYIAGVNEHAPAVASLNGVIANLAITEFMGHVTGCKPLSRYVYYNFLKPLVAPVEFPKKPDCFSCSEDTLLGCGDGGLTLPEYAISCKV